jgi:hypothetical protein
MKLDKISTGLMVTANVGVLVGLIFVVFELRQNQKSLDASIQLTLSAAHQEIASRVVENRDFAEVLEKSFWRPDDLDIPDAIRLTNWIQEYLVLLFATYELRNKGVVSEATWEHNALYFAGFLENPNFRDHYEKYSRDTFPEEFFLAIEEHIGEGHFP